MSEPLLLLEGISKSYREAVLRRVDFRLQPGRVHALMGANGAGKSTLCNIITGLVPADSGSMQLRGRRYRPRSLRASEASGIRFVKQELTLIPDLNVADNLFLSGFVHRFGILSKREMLEHARGSLHDIGLAEVEPRQTVGSLGVGQQQLVEIARALLWPCDVLILDEPTASLTVPQVDLLFERIRALKTAGTAIVYVSHRMEELPRIADDISVLRDGQIVYESETTHWSESDIVSAMAGSAVKRSCARTTRERSAVAFQLRGVTNAGGLRSIDLDLHAGEILGIAGLIGAGRTELLRCMFGATPISAGTLKLGPKLDLHTFSSPAGAVRSGIGMIPEDRKQHGLMLDQSVEFNIAISSLDITSSRWGIIDARAIQTAVAEQTELLGLKAVSQDQSVAELSGGNQQKVLISRWLLCDCQVLLFDEPTRGIDMATRETIYALLARLADAGKAVLLVSSEPDELMRLCDRIAVMARGRIVAEFVRGEWTEEKLMSAALGITDGEEAA